jgi:hypothetical protein
MFLVLYIDFLAGSYRIHEQDEKRLNTKKALEIMGKLDGKSPCFQEN